MREILTKEIERVLTVMGISNDVRIDLEIPNDKSHGDYSSNVAMMLAKTLKQSPRKLATDITERLNIDKTIVEKVDIAGAGFINFFVADAYLIEGMKTIVSQAEGYGSQAKNGQKAIVEYVSANPTGPLTIGRGRGAALGDTIANILATQGYEITREYYFNNAGRQMQILAESVKFRYQELLGETILFPETHYQGEYIIDIAQAILKEYGNSKKDEPPFPFFKELAESQIFASIKETLKKIKVVHDSFFSETELYVKNPKTGTSPNEEVIKRLRDKGYVEEKEGATWFLTTKLGLEKDKALIKSTGEPTYRLPDMAYHVKKYERGFDLMVNVFGADHIDEYPDVLSALDMMGYDTQKVKVAINQFVTMTVDGKTVKMSTRKGNAELLDDLIDDVGADVARFFFLMRGKESHLNFDLDLAKEQSTKNPVFYLQYAHARLNSILQLAEQSLNNKSTNANIVLTQPEEKRLAKSLLRYPEVLTFSAEALEPQKVVAYLATVAEAFHQFYESCRVVGEDEQVLVSRMLLCRAAKQVLKNGLEILGVSAKDKM